MCLELRSACEESMGWGTFYHEFVNLNKACGSNLVDPASSDMLVLKTKPCIFKFKTDESTTL